MSVLRFLPAFALAAMLAVPPAGAQAPQPAPQSEGKGAPARPPPAAGKAKTSGTPVVTAPVDTHAQKPGRAANAGRAVGAAAPPADKRPAEPPPAGQAGEPPKGSVTGLPLPRWASLRADEVNLRTGPGTRYPIEWVYRRRDLPVQIEREFEVWRLIADQDGVKGWVHQATLTGRRSFVVWGGERVMRRRAADDAAAVARLQAGVVGRLRACDAAAAWCEVQVGEYRGFLKRDEMYGIYPGEAVN